MEILKEINDYIIDQDLDIDKLIDDFTPYVTKIINNMANSLTIEDKEEILIDTFFVLWKNNSLINITYLKSYIAGITRNLVKEKLRKRNFTYDISKYDNIINFANIDLFLEERLEIEKSLEILSELELKIINLFYYSSKSIKEIAKELNMSEMNVRTRLYRIRKKLKKYFGIGGVNNEK